MFQSAFLRLKSAKITSFINSRGVMINAAYIENDVSGISVFVSYDNRRREYLSRCSPQAGTHTRKLTFQQDSHIRSNSSPPSHSRCTSLDRLSPSTSCFGRFRCAKNNTQLFLTCYISPLKSFSTKWIIAMVASSRTNL